ncbi:MAG: ATP-binding protein, partial [Albidovulum sp.]|uniref:ATP-binding protein n=1 Tax=Albidovulum sp. TaxID=1872424 RepID=UPI003C858098
VMYVAIWVAYEKVAPDGANEYLYRFALISLAGTVFLPFMFIHAAFLQGLVFLPIFYYLMVDHVGDGDDIRTWLGPGFLLTWVVIMGLYAKYFSERTLRANYVQSFQLEQARREAERANDAKSQFLATTSHELRTPLNGVLGNIRLIKLEGEDRGPIDERLDEIERSSLAMRNLIDDVLNMARLEANVENAVFRPFELGEIIRDLRAALQPLARSKELELHLPHIEAPLYLLGDGGQLRHILLNLLGNAVKFTRSGYIALTFEPSGEAVTFRVSDTGIGIPENQLSSIFETFAQASNVETSEMGGTGLGLSIVRRLVAALDGEVTVESTLGQGTTFQVVLPFQKTSAAQPDKRAIGTATTVGTKLRVLVVEDDATNMEVLTSLLRYDGHSIVQAVSGKQAKEVFRPGETDCILSDIRLPDMKGVQLVQELAEIAHKADPDRRVPAIAVTANVMPEDIDEYAMAGFDHVVSKPLDERKLFGAMKAVIGAGPVQLSPDISADTGRMTRLRELLGEEEFRKVRAAFRLTLEECLSGLERAIEQDDHERIRFLAHRMAGSSGSIGVTELEQISRSLEGQMARMADFDRTTLERLLACCRRVLDEFDVIVRAA